MKRFSIFFLVIAALISQVSPAPAGANGQLDQILANMQKNAQGIKTIYAKMTQEKRDPVVGGKEIYRGEIFLKHAGPGNDKVRINYTSPSRQSVSVIGDEIVLYQPNINQAIITSRKAQAAKNQEFSFVGTPYNSVPELKNRYNIVLKGQEQVGGASTAVLELTPKGASAAQKLTMWVDQSTWFPVKYQVVEKNGNVSSFSLSEIRKNTAMGDGLFKIKFADGTKFIRQ
ncbi:MAG TPA: outer membrane lipoprotein carrier protein LolA [Blastocatellia bacterium]|nr:outer membrane lipoprotein carrier protein LolA [Blastocatellia bacterium]